MICHQKNELHLQQSNVHSNLWSKEISSIRSAFLSVTKTFQRVICARLESSTQIESGEQIRILSAESISLGSSSHLPKGVIGCLSGNVNAYKKRLSLCKSNKIVRLSSMLIRQGLRKNTESFPIFSTQDLLYTSGIYSYFGYVCFDESRQAATPIVIPKRKKKNFQVVILICDFNSDKSSYQYLVRKIIILTNH